MKQARAIPRPVVTKGGDKKQCSLWFEASPSLPTQSEFPFNGVMFEGEKPLPLASFKQANILTSTTPIREEGRNPVRRQPHPPPNQKSLTTELCHAREEPSL